MNLSRRQKEVLEFIKDFIHERGYPPTIREIGSHFGFTWIRARQYLHILEKKGFIREIKNTSRGIVIIDERERRIPVLGRVYAGNPNLRVECKEEDIVVDRTLFGEDCFSLVIKGVSMVGAGILPGDYVIIKQQKNLRDGDIGVVIIDDEVTLKRVFFKDDSVILKPENPEMESITFRKEDVNILGKVVGLIRRM